MIIKIILINDFISSSYNQNDKINCLIRLVRELRKTSWIKICGEEKLCERRMNITMARRNLNGRNHFVFILPNSRVSRAEKE